MSEINGIHAPFCNGTSSYIGLPNSPCNGVCRPNGYDGMADADIIEEALDELTEGNFHYARALIEWLTK